MSYKDWYTLNTLPTGDFQCVAMDKDLNYQKEYIISMNGGTAGNCSCIAGHTWCRHKKMLVLFQQRQLVGSRTYYNFDKEKWLTQPKMEV